MFVSSFVEFRVMDNPQIFFAKIPKRVQTISHVPWSTAVYMMRKIGVPSTKKYQQRGHDDNVIIQTMASSTDQTTQINSFFSVARGDVEFAGGCSL